MTILENKRLTKLYHRATTKKMQHTLFWICTGLFMFFLGKPDHFGVIYALNILAQLFCLMLMVYINTLVLVPTFLQKNEVTSYLINLIILSFFVSFLSVVFHYWILYGFEYEQRILIRQGQIILFILHFFIGVASTVYIVISQWMVGEHEKKILESKQVQTELNFLKSQINPHFLFNVLNSLYALTLKKSDLAPDIVIKLSEMMRYMLYESNESTVNLEKEISYLKNYIDLEKIRLGNRMEVISNFSGNPQGKKIIPLLFINFVENSFKHGSPNHFNEKGYVKLDLKIEDEKIIFNLENSISSKQKKEDKSLLPSGIGLQNVKNRLDLWYKEQYSLNYIQTTSSYIVNFTINI